MSTGSDIIKGSLRLINAIAAGEAPSAAEQADALSALNDMLESWSNERLLVYAITRETFSLVAGTQNYTIGSGGDFDTLRPIKIEKALLQYQSSPLHEQPIKVLTLEQWASIQSKETDSDYPTALYYDPASPLGTLKFWPKPSAAKTLVLHSQKPLASITDASATLTLPPGYNRALKYNLAIELAPEYGQEASNTVAMIANEAKANIKRGNIKDNILGVDSALMKSGSSFNWRTGE